MDIRAKRPWRLLVALVATVALASGMFAFAASNTMPSAANAGDGAVAISGYTVSALAYALNATTASNIDTVTFTISPTAAATVKTQLATGGSWYSCTNTAGSVSCTTTAPQATVAGATNITIVAAQ